MPSQADEIRRHALECYVWPWRKSGASTLSVQAGDVVRTMGLRDRTPNVCSALGSHKFLQEAGLALIERRGPRQSTTTTFRYRRSDASSAQSCDPEPPVSRPQRAHNGVLPAANLCLVSCVKKKLPGRASAKELYDSNWFRKARALVEAEGWPWRILSAKYGLVDPDTVIEPYEKTLNAMRRNERVEWSRKVMSALDPRLAGVDSVVIFAGEKYREFLTPELRKRGITVHVPMEGLRSGEQLVWLNERLDR